MERALIMLKPDGVELGLEEVVRQRAGVIRFQSRLPRPNFSSAAVKTSRTSSKETFSAASNRPTLPTFTRLIFTK